MTFFQKTLITSFILTIIVNLNNASAMEPEQQKKRSLEQSQHSDTYCGLEPGFLEKQPNKRQKIAQENRLVMFGQDGKALVVGSNPTNSSPSSSSESHDTENTLLLLTNQQPIISSEIGSGNSPEHMIEEGATPDLLLEASEQDKEQENTQNHSSEPFAQDSPQQNDNLSPGFNKEIDFEHNRRNLGVISNPTTSASSSSSKSHDAEITPGASEVDQRLEFNQANFFLPNEIHLEFPVNLLEATGQENGKEPSSEALSGSEQTDSYHEFNLEQESDLNEHTENNPSAHPIDQTLTFARENLPGDREISPVDTIEENAENDLFQRLLEASELNENQENAQDPSFELFGQKPEEIDNLRRELNQLIGRDPNEQRDSPKQTTPTPSGNKSTLPKKPTPQRKKSKKPQAATTAQKKQLSRVRQVVDVVKKNPKATVGLVGLGIGLVGLANVISDPASTIAATIGCTSGLGGLASTGYKYLYPTPSEIEVLETNIKKLKQVISHLNSELDALIAQANEFLLSNNHAVGCMSNIMQRDNKDKPINVLEAQSNMQSLFKNQTDAQQRCTSSLLLINKKRLELLENQMALIEQDHKLNYLLIDSELAACHEPEQHNLICTNLIELTEKYEDEKKNLLVSYNEIFKKFIQSQKTCNQAFDGAIEH